MPICSHKDLTLTSWLIKHLEDRQEEVQLPKSNSLQVQMADLCLEVSKTRNVKNHYRVEKQG